MRAPRRASPGLPCPVETDRPQDVKEHWLPERWMMNDAG